MKPGQTKIHIMHVQESLEVGGMENGIVNLVNRMDKGVFSLSVCCINRTGALRERIVDRSVKVFDLGQKEGIACGLPFRLRALFRKERVDIVHTHNFYSGFYGIPGARLAGVPLVVHGEHGTLVLDKRARAIAIRLLSAFVDSFLTVSKALKEDFIRKTGIDAGKVKVIVNGVDTEKFSVSLNKEEQKRRLNIAANSKVIGSVGRLVPVKNYRLLLEAAQRLSAEDINLTCVFLGDGPCRQDLKRSAEKYGLKALFLGERSGVAEVLAALDVFVLSSLNEGMSNTILEAMAAGKPVVATDVGGNSELVNDGITGFLVASGDQHALAAKIKTLLGDQRLAAAMGTAGKEKIEREFSLQRMVTNYENFYYSLINKGSA